MFKNTLHLKGRGCEKGQPLLSQTCGSHSMEAPPHSAWARGFLVGASGKEPACQYRSCGRQGFYPWVRRSLAGGHGNLFLYSGLQDRGAWWATVHRVGKSQTRLKWLSTLPGIWNVITCSLNTSFLLPFPCLKFTTNILNFQRALQKN